VEKHQHFGGRHFLLNLQVTHTHKTCNIKIRNWENIKFHDAVLYHAKCKSIIRMPRKTNSTMDKSYSREGGAWMPTSTLLPLGQPLFAADA
jgi:hypothetical protein